MTLPPFVEPMLARLAREPFDSDEHRFEVKWDGTRALAFVEGGGYRLRNRKDRDMVARYPELAFLAELPSGTVLDGELVMLADGKPNFRAMLRREQARNLFDIENLAREIPATYVVFDLLYDAGRPVLDLPLAQRLERLAGLVAAAGQPTLVLSEGVVGSGIAFFDEIAKLEMEGIVAKRLASPYLPGRRTDAWQKIKPVRQVHAAILGWQHVDGDVRSLIIAIEEEGSLRCVGKVGSGLTEAMRARMRELFEARRTDAPWIACDVEGDWIEPGLFCTVSYLERTNDGNLRAPVFLELFTDDSWQAERSNDD